jgi:UDP-N-acetylmuramyl tripeptide synthase
MNIKTSIAIFLCKFSRFAIRKLGRGGTDMPGRIALKVCPDLLGRLAKGVTTVIVTGTNGKTTTSRMIEQAMTDSGISFFANRSGANLLSGVTAEFAVHSGTLSGKCKYPYALIEADEAAFKAISTFVDAKTVVVTNVFRDQLDRYGEVTHTLDNIRIGISHSPNAVLCLNADDSLSASLGTEFENPKLYYGVNVPIYRNRVDEVSDAPYCIRCKHEYVYDYVTYGHLGGYHCPHCGYGRPVPEVAVSQVNISDAEHSEIVLEADGQSYPTLVNLPGGYNIYNAAACMACGKAMKLDPQTVSESLGRFQCGFGRMEKFDIHGTPVRMILIKNPAGCNQVLNFLTNTQTPAVFVACLNDRAQDGKDVSWIWDVDFERLLDMGDNLKDIYVSGVRADDMALRFRYAGIPMEKIHVEKDYEKLMEAVTSQPDPVYVMPTYTAMLNLRDKISRLYGFKEYWEA